ncbi:MAG TPA: ABC transporter permease [Streptosporangiaceae bacterium]|jgi:D-xylose transport system permease protein|nr:ABC transporter permease [Streptosporangiaceae bacterium]
MSTKSTNPSDVQLPDTAVAVDLGEQSVGSALRDYGIRLRSGDLGALPAILGLVVLGLLFTALRPETFLSNQNIANLLVQALPVTILAMGLVFVLLLGEIDLAAGVTGGVSAAVLATLLSEQNQPWYVATLAGLGTGLLIGLVTGWLVAVLGIPSFVVTLAFFLGLQGISLRLVGEGGTVPVNDEVIVALANKNLPLIAGWVLAWVCVVGYSAAGLIGWYRKRARGLARPPLPLVVARVVVVSLLILGGTSLLSQDRARSPVVFLGGIPWGVLLVAVLLIVCTFVLGRTAYGRHIYAVGGNSEAARRAGINVTSLRISVFVISSTIAAISGIVAASRLNSATPDAGTRTELLLAVGAAVIGGTSLFGGKGKARDAVLGGLVIAVIANGLGLLGAKAYAQFLITGGFLLLAASVDALARRRRSATGG